MSFLEDVADHLLSTHADRIGECNVVFPNKRAGIFLKKQLAKKIKKPVWSPHTLSLENFLFQFSDILKTDSLHLVFELYQSFKHHYPFQESFEEFYSKGETLLKDFEEIDHYLVDPTQLFKYIEDDRQMQEEFYFLDQEQEQIIQHFWKGFFPTRSKSQTHFIEIWKVLSPVYSTFKEKIVEKGIGYPSHIYRQLLEKLPQKNDKRLENLLFVGFNALSPAEEKLIKHFIVQHHAEIIWDVDAHYLSQETQEAGSFLRGYQKDSIFANTFPKNPANRINSSKKKVEVTGTALEVGQARLVGEKIRHLLKNGEAQQEDIVVILPQDYMLFPVLNSLPPEVTKLNVTMGYPLQQTPVFGLLDAVLEAQTHKQRTPEHWLTFYHKPVLEILGHPYLYESNKKEIDELIGYIQSNNQIRVLQQEIERIGSPLLNEIFRDLKNEESLSTYLFNIIASLEEQIIERFGIEKTFLYHFKTILGRLDEILDADHAKIELKMFKKLFKKATNSMHIPFSGEPVQGLQIMGMLETRNLDFEHVFMINMNEGVFPSARKNTSFIPYRIRKAFDLPTFETQEAFYAYLFYRLFHVAENFSFYYNVHAEFGLSGEVSRFIRQIELESQMKITYFKLNNPIEIRDSSKITIEKTEDIIQRLQYYTTNGRGKLSASAINTYLDCELRFYFKYVLRIFPKDELNDELTPRDFGNILHHTMEYLYEDIIEKKGTEVIEKKDFFLLKNSISGAIEKSFHTHFNLKKKQRFQIKRRNKVMAEIMTQFVKKTLSHDEKYAPFEIVSLENHKRVNYDKVMSLSPDEKEYKVVLRGIIDRVDKKNNRVRVVDYKSGKDASEIVSIETLFDTNTASKRNKAGFQTLFYSMLYASKNGLNEIITPTVINIQELFVSNFDERLKMKGIPLDDARPHLNEYEARFKEVLHKIYGASHPFRQTEELKKCAYCEFNGICAR